MLHQLGGYAARPGLIGDTVNNYKRKRESVGLDADADLCTEDGFDNLGRN